MIKNVRKGLLTTDQYLSVSSHKAQSSMFRGIIGNHLGFAMKKTHIPLFFYIFHYSEICKFPYDADILVGPQHILINTALCF